MDMRISAHWRVLVTVCLLGTVLSVQAQENDLLFIHHSCGENWLNDGLNDILLGKSYIDEVNEIYYGDTLSPDPGRPASLGEVPGDNTNMNHWILWFNDYLAGIQQQGSEDGRNAIVMFKSCYPTSNVSSDGTPPGNPFADEQTIANYQSVYRNSTNPAGTYRYEGAEYRSLEQIFAAHPDILFIPVTAPPMHYGPYDDSSNANARRARRFNNWLIDEWLPSYQAAHPDLNNVAVFDWFDILAYPDNHADHPNRLRREYGGNEGDSHPNTVANQLSATQFSTFIETAYALWTGGEVPEPPGSDQPANLEVFHRSGQSFLTWSEREDIVGEQYVIYRHTQPITSSNLSSAEILATLPEGTCAYWTERMRDADYPPEQNAGYRSLRNYVIQPLGEELPDGTGFFVWTAHRDQNSYYAVTMIQGGSENRTDFSSENTDGPIPEQVADPSPILVWQSENGLGRVYTQFMDYSQWNPTYETPDGLTYAYNYFVGLPSAEVCNGPVLEPMALLLHIEGYGTRYEAGDGSHYFCCVELWCDDPRQSWYYGYSATHDYGNRDAEVATGPIVNFSEQRLLRAIYDLLRDENYSIDPQRIYTYGHSMGGSGALALGMRYPNVFAASYSSEPMTNYGNSGFWIADDLEPKWGGVELNLPIENRGRYAADLVQYNGMGVWDWQNHQAQLVERRGDEMAYLTLAHGTQDEIIIWESQGNPAYEPFNRSRRAYSGQTVTADHTWIGFNGMGPNLLGGSAMFGGPFADFQMVRNETIPAITYASGSGSLPPNGVASYNMNIEWSASWNSWNGSPIDTAEMWSVSLRTTDGSTQEVDVTSRRTQHFQVAPGQTFYWENRRVSDNGLVRSGTIVADTDGLVTIENVQVSGEGNQLMISSDSDIEIPTATPTPLQTATSTPTPRIVMTPTVVPTSTPFNPSTISIPIEIAWPEDGYAEPVPITVGVPLPPGVSIPEALTISGPDGPIPCQSTIRTPEQITNSSYGWVYFDFIAERGVSYRVVNGTPPVPPQSVSVTGIGGGGYRVNTGAATFEIVPDNRIFTSILDSNGAPLVTGALWGNSSAIFETAPAEIEIIKSGPVCVAITLRSPEAVDGLDLVARLYFYAGLPYAKVRLTLVNHNDAVLGSEMPNANNGECGVQPNQPIIQGLDCPNTIIFDDITWALQLQTPAEQSRIIYQDSSGTDNWDFYATTDLGGAAGMEGLRMQAGVRRRGYVQIVDGVEVETGDAAAGALVAGGVRLDVPYFRELFPKALRVRDNRIEFGIFPGEFSFDHRLRPGEQKTHDVWISLNTEQSSPPSLLAHPSFEWLRKTHAIGYFGPRIAGRYFAYEDYLDAQFDPTRENLDGLARSVNDAQEMWDLFGWMDYGDFPTDFEDGRSPYNVKYDSGLGFLHQALRIGGSDWRHWAEISNKHFADIDIFHTRIRGYEGDRLWHQGGAWGHSLHDESGLTNPHRNCNNPHPDLYYGFTGMAAWSLLTGDEAVREAAIEMAENTMWRIRNSGSPCAVEAWGGGNGSGFAVDDDFVSLRSAANSTRILVWAWRLTGDPAYLDAAGRTAEWYNCARNEQFECGSWQTALFIRALGEYILTARECGRAVNPAAEEAMLHGLNAMGTHLAREGNRAWFSGCTGDEINAWMLLGADAFALGYAVTGDRVWLDEYAAPCFNTGSEDPFYRGDRPHYHSSKELVNAVAAGTIFIHFHSQFAAESTPTPPPAGTIPPSTSTPIQPQPTVQPTEVPIVPTPVPPSGSGTMIFQDGNLPYVNYFGVDDTIITEIWQTNTQMGSAPFLSTYRDYQERNRILMRFDLDIFSRNTTIRDARLSLYEFEEEYSEEAQTVVVHRITTPWVEGTGQFEFPAETYVPDGATWALASPGNTWTTPGGDFDAREYATTAVPDYAAPGWIEWDITELTMEWVSGAYPNYGLMLRTQDAEWQGHRFYSSEAESVEHRPKLAVDYSVPVGVEEWMVY